MCRQRVELLAFSWFLHLQRDAFRYSKNTIAYLIFFIKTRPHNSPKEKLYYRKFWVLLQGKLFSMWVYFTIYSTTTHLTVLGWTNIGISKHSSVAFGFIILIWITQFYCKVQSAKTDKKNYWLPENKREGYT